MEKNIGQYNDDIRSEFFSTATEWYAQHNSAILPDLLKTPPTSSILPCTSFMHYNFN